MPIYAYKCEACGYAKDVLQRMSDPLLTECPQCRAASFAKQVTAAGFQLKGAGWYVTDFRGGEKVGEGANSGIATAPKTDTPPAAGTPSAAPASTAAPTPAASPAPVAAPVAKAAPAPAASGGA